MKKIIFLALLLFEIIIFFGISKKIKELVINLKNKWTKIYFCPIFKIRGIKNFLKENYLKKILNNIIRGFFWGPKLTEI